MFKVIHSILQIIYFDCLITQMTHQKGWSVTFLCYRLRESINCVCLIFQVLIKNLVWIRVFPPGLVYNFNTQQKQNVCMTAASPKIELHGYRDLISPVYHTWFHDEKYLLNHLTITLFVQWAGDQSPAADLSLNWYELFA